MTADAASLAEALGCTLARLGVRAGDTVYVAASLAGFAQLAQPARTVLDVLQAAVGAEGTLLMPSGNGSFRSEGLFDRERSESRSGMLSEYFRTRTDVDRTCVPPFNTICAWGRDGADWAAIESETAFGPGSVFDRMIEENVLAVLLGCSFHDGAAHVHWLEERHDVRYRNWVDVSGILIRDGVPHQRTFSCHARRPGVEVDGARLGQELSAAGASVTADVGLARITAFELGCFDALLDDAFRKDPEILVRRTA